MLNNQETSVESDAYSESGPGEQSQPVESHLYEQLVHLMNEQQAEEEKKKKRAERKAELEAAVQELSDKVEAEKKAAKKKELQDELDALLKKQRAAEAEEQEAKKLEEARQEYIDQLKQKADDRVANFSAEQKQFLNLLTKLSGEETVKGLENARMAGMHDDVIGNDFFQRLRGEGRAVDIDERTGEMRLHYKSGGYLSVQPGEGGTLKITLRKTKMTEEAARDIIHLQKARNAGGLKIRGKKSAAQMLWREAKRQGLDTYDNLKDTYTPSKSDMEWLAQEQARQQQLEEQYKDAMQQNQDLSSAGLLEIVPAITNGFQTELSEAPPAAIMNAEPGDDLYETKGRISAYGRLMSAIGYETQPDGTASFKGTDLNDNQIAQIAEILNNNPSYQDLEKAVEIANPDGKELESILEQDLENMLEYQKQMEIAQAEQLIDQSSGFLGRMKLKRMGIGPAELEALKAAVEDSREQPTPVSRFQVKSDAEAPVTKPEDKPDMKIPGRFGEKPVVKTADEKLADSGSRYAAPKEKSLEGIGFLQQGAKPAQPKAKAPGKA